jgi:hypothetical protein
MLIQCFVQFAGELHELCLLASSGGTATARGLGRNPAH